MYRSLMMVVFLSVFALGECNKEEQEDKKQNEEIELAFISSTCSGNLEYKEEADKPQITFIKEEPAASLFEKKI